LFELLKLSQVPGNLAIKKMSDGQKQKIKLLAFLSANPKVIILDEFTNALDKNSALDLYHFLSIYNKMHEVVIINITHNLSDLEYMEGKYYYIHNHKIDQIESKKEIIEMYVKGE
jgi:putative peptide transport system ATP-binding protein